ncbi:enoyl-CoA hydratase/isomerase family protein [Tersicoccus sp. Bi-70]|uniref:enoyl-CoA hydratase/isomerase family protein n=1 Tax=Tersicoccus sp. Bi-70 TaxID=1897634 RepID=UPI00097861D8|nr:enoyl-CoA hydratase/isomerase family protein [Tersicoccus sp. Bi-70]OMH32315.1 3-hydroxyisobutyryl-CoA hydrolase [Tersicoccus sp. Bi-70]
MTPEQAPGAEEAPVLTEVRGHLGVITLNRPRAVNALTEPMVELMLDALARWRDDDTVAQVLVRGAGERGLCAGGDIVAIYRDMTAGDAGAIRQDGRRDTSASERFWAREYLLNAIIAEYPKPYVAFMDGLVLGGGIGISAHGSHRLVTERTRSGMPETTIGFAPDVGGTWLLSRPDGGAGLHAALTGAHLDAADALHLGLADHLVAAEDLDAIATALETEPADDVVARFAAEAVPASALADGRTWIDDAYGQDSPAAVLDRLDELGRTGHEEAAGTAATIREKSPTSVTVTFEGIRRARDLPRLEDALASEYRVGLRLLQGHDFPEGVRAQVIDKDRTPHWEPPTLAEVEPATVEACFAGLGEDELDLTAVDETATKDAS